MDRRVTILDVAKRAGVSKVTVSYVLNGRGHEMGIRPETVTRIAEAAKELGYRPNALARMLSRRRADTLAILFQSGGSFSRTAGFNGEVLDGVAQACYEEDFDLMLHTRQMRDFEHEADSLLDGRVDGILILRDVGDPTFERLSQARIPLVQFFSHTDGSKIPSIDCDNVLAGEMATRHLIDLGHRRIVALGGSQRSVSSADRLQGFLNAMQEAGLDAGPEQIMPDMSLDGYLSSLYQLLDSAEPPTALFVWCDQLAVAVMKRLQAGGIRVPDDISIVGFDSLQVAESSNPPLTSVHQPVRKMAMAATRILISLVRGDPVGQVHRIFPPRLDKRATTGAPRERPVLRRSRLAPEERVDGVGLL
jgi:LacI family transcriptional regulator